MVKTETRELPCKLTEKELLTASKELAANLSALNRLDSEKKSFNAEIMSRRSDLEVSLNDAVEIVQTGSVRRFIACIVKTLFDEGIVQVTRSDTSEIIEQRPIRDEERQTEMPNSPDDGDETTKDDLHGIGEYPDEFDDPEEEED